MRSRFASTAWSRTRRSACSAARPSRRAAACPQAGEPRLGRGSSPPRASRACGLRPSRSERHLLVPLHAPRPAHQLHRKKLRQSEFRLSGGRPHRTQRLEERRGSVLNVAQNWFEVVDSRAVGPRAAVHLLLHPSVAHRDDPARRLPNQPHPDHAAVREAREPAAGIEVGVIRLRTHVRTVSASPAPEPGAHATSNARRSAFLVGGDIASPAAPSARSGMPVSHS